mgnify:CR=1 FL=1
MRSQTLAAQRCLARGTFAFLALTLGSPQQSEAKEVDFAREVLPILSNKCFVCHGPDAKKEDDLRLDSYQGATEDRDGLRATDPDNPEDSELILRIHDADDPMPPKDADKQRKEALKASKEALKVAKESVTEDEASEDEGSRMAR